MGRVMVADLDRLICSDCHTEKAARLFSVNRSRQTGRCSYCKDCQRRRFNANKIVVQCKWCKAEFRRPPSQPHSICGSCNRKRSRYNNQIFIQALERDEAIHSSE